MKKKNSAAIELNRLRWQKTTAAQRKVIASRLGKASAAALTPAERTARAKNAAKARKKK